VIAITGHFEFKRIVLGHLVEGLRADAVIALQGLLDFEARRQAESTGHWASNCTAFSTRDRTDR
jgi:hypothetical protein